MAARRPPESPGRNGRAAVRPLRDPRSEITAKELQYAATALRADAHRAEQQAADPSFHSSREIFLKSAMVYADLAEKLGRIANLIPLEK